MMMPIYSGLAKGKLKINEVIIPLSDVYSIIPMKNKLVISGKSIGSMVIEVKYNAEKVLQKLREMIDEGIEIIDLSDFVK